MKNLTKVFLIAFCAFANFLNLNGQNTVYTDLFTSSNFIKTINTTLPVGTIGGEASVSKDVYKRQGKYVTIVAIQVLAINLLQ